MLKKIGLKKQEGEKRTWSEFEEIDHLTSLIPDSPLFWGEEMFYPLPKKNFWSGLLSDKGPDISLIRDDVHSFSKGESLSKTRSILAKYLKKYPENPDIHALKAIMMYNDLSQSSRTGDKVELMGEALLEIGKALHNGGGSIFNATWFMTIYLKYLEILGVKLSRKYKKYTTSQDRQVKLSAEKLYHKLAKIPRLLQVQSNLRTLTRLNMKLKGSSYITDPITPKEIQEACQAIANRKEKKIGKSGRPANSVIHVTMAIYSVFCRIPALEDLVKNILHNIPNVCQELILQKQLIINTGKTTQFHILLASGNHDQAKILANDIYENSLGAIQRHLKDSILFKQYEVDPYLKLAWVALEARHLFQVKERRERLKDAVEKIKFLLDERCQHGNSLKIASYYQHEMESILDTL